MNKHHTINYIEFTAENASMIKDFYTAVFGWEFTDFGPEYIAFNDGVLDGGFTIGGTPKETSTRVILYSDYLEDTLTRVEECGGMIVKPIFSFPGGRRFHFKDPAGNELAVWSEG
tara:strand:- start:64 stop:408 length:345 start_codon:yes stop_codon:yes gene_type:complete